jgi:hypothetical protein
MDLKLKLLAFKFCRKGQTNNNGRFGSSLIVSPASFPALKVLTESAHLWAPLYGNMSIFPIRDVRHTITPNY